MKLTDKQREALEALRDVMVKYDIEARFNQVEYGHIVRYIVNGKWVVSDENMRHGKVSATTITKLLGKE